jgi:hypothetical protein
MSRACERLAMSEANSKRRILIRIIYTKKEKGFGINY